MIMLVCPDHEYRMHLRSPDGTGYFRRVTNSAVLEMCRAVVEVGLRECQICHQGELPFRGIVLTEEYTSQLFTESPAA
jgi:hypothetical protein